MIYILRIHCIESGHTWMSLHPTAQIARTETMKNPIVVIAVEQDSSCAWRHDCPDDFDFVMTRLYENDIDISLTEVPLSQELLSALIPPIPYTLQNRRSK